MGDQQPFNALTGMIGVQTGDTAGAAALGTDAAGTGGFSGLVICSANLPDKIAISVDAQTDDGAGKSSPKRSLCNPLAATYRGGSRFFASGRRRVKRCREQSGR